MKYFVSALAALLLVGCSQTPAQPVQKAQKARITPLLANCYRADHVKLAKHFANLTDALQECGEKLRIWRRCCWSAAARHLLNPFKKRKKHVLRRKLR
jgi:hypothetical protein